jgi:hypothetical protein
MGSREREVTRSVNERGNQSKTNFELKKKISKKINYDLCSLVTICRSKT